MGEPRLRPVTFRGLVFLLAVLPTLASRDAAGAERSSDTAAVDALVRKALKAWHVPGVAVAVVRDDEVIYLKGAGVKELGHKDAVTPDTVFPLGSCTKAFTTTAMAMLVDDGKMGWDDPPRKYVNFFHLADPLADAEVTLRDLVTHRTGVGGNDLLWYRSPWTQEDIIRRIGLVKPYASFRSRFLYQTTMFTAAGHAVAHAAGCPWDAFVRKRILDPLGMPGASFTTPAALKNPDHASGHRANDRGEVEVVPWYRIDRPDPAGSLNASVRDLSKWLRFQLGDGAFEGRRLVSAANLRETRTPQMVIRLEGSAGAMQPDTHQMNYGLGWVIQDYRGRHLISHAGAIDGFRCHLTLVPEARIGIALLNNLDSTQMNLALSNSIVDLLLGLPAKDWNGYLLEQVRKEKAAKAEYLRQREARRHQGTKPSRELRAYTGAYEHPAYGTVHVEQKGGELTWKWNSFTCPLRHYHYDTFTITDDVLQDPFVSFTLGTDGNVKRMKVEGRMGVEFKKVVSAPP
jgi:CubicO group peptidase (beta-lactamase class C family)